MRPLSKMLGFPDSPACRSQITPIILHQKGRNNMLIGISETFGIREGILELFTFIIVGIIVIAIVDIRDEVINNLHFDASSP